MTQRALGTKLKIGSGVSAVAIGGLKSISSPSMSQETIDVTTLDSDGGYREFIGSFKDGGEVSASGFFNPQNEGQAAVYEALENSTDEDFEIEFPAAMKAKWVFRGVVTAYNTSAELEDAISFEITIKVSGKPELKITQ
ncbi:phage tail tube protein [Paenibacillus sp. D2_2]|uniref:phage tail tube protein n=1 Tax=Paenibacillus sp. D2_2 TaxID=3073092 RepID=UPI002815979F|nr:phage tail tube protein [Paenibacillus sp. D2_2]WMT42849.1 phage tail tube protein [Paenibacillus sp. D2_2]